MERTNQDKKIGTPGLKTSYSLGVPMREKKQKFLIQNGWTKCWKEAFKF
jgi:hypothetical protein